MDHPIGPPTVRELIRAILVCGSVHFSRHALEEMEKDRLSEIDIANVLRGGVVDPGEYENGSWRYAVRTQRIKVVIAFRSEDKLVVVTAWRFSQ